ncbi:MAG: hypothetical protein V7767_08190, partial [Leeuwenhoekiella sp.]
MQEKTITENILLKPFDEAPFSQIQVSDYKPAIKAAIEQARNEIDAITALPDEPTFENTIEALDFSG